MRTGLSWKKINEPERRLNFGLLLNHLAKDNPSIWADFWHTAYVGYDKPLEGETNPKEFTICTGKDWATVLTECGFTKSKSEAHRLGFTGDIPVGYSEHRPSDSMFLSIWNKP